MSKTRSVYRSIYLYRSTAQRLDNEPIANETTKGKRMTLLFSPSFTMLWKATDNWTLSAGGSYGMYPTNWRNLMTAYLMSNYRTLNRYKVNLSENKSATIHGKIHYKNIPHQFFAYLSGAVSRSWSDILYGTTIDQNAHTLLQAEYAPNHSNNYSITISTRKEIACTIRVLAQQLNTPLTQVRYYASLSSPTISLIASLSLLTLPLILSSISD